MTTLFVSDLHLDEQRPAITRLFLRFLETEAAAASALYILGDLFEAWIGDDDPGDAGLAVAAALAALRDRGVRCAFMHGNRDFLLGRAYAARAGLRLLPDPAVVLLGGEPVLLSHGDAFCTGDLAYQRFRAQTRDAEWRRAFLAQPVEARRAFARQARAASAEHQRALATCNPEVATGNRPAPMDITDVAAETIEATFRRYGVRRMIHGHTHRPAVHELLVDGQPCERIVLGDWYEQGSVLRVDASGVANLSSLPL